MTIDEIRAELKARKWTQAQLAEKLHMNAKALSGILCGARPLTETLASHIELLLEKEVNLGPTKHRTAEEIKEKLKEKGWSIADFARKLGVGYSTLQTVLSGRNPLTKPLEKLINYELNALQEHIVVYKVSIPDARVEELCCDCHTEAERRAVISALLRHNMAALAVPTSSERQLLGLDTPSNSYHHEG